MNKDKLLVKDELKMTSQEALNNIQSILEDHGVHFGHPGEKTLEAFRIINDLVKKDISYEVPISSVVYDTNPFGMVTIVRSGLCKCGEPILDTHERIYCQCGQKLDWSGEPHKVYDTLRLKNGFETLIERNDKDE